MASLVEKQGSLSSQNQRTPRMRNQSKVFRKRKFVLNRDEEKLEKDNAASAPDVTDLPNKKQKLCSESGALRGKRTVSEHVHDVTDSDLPNKKQKLCSESGALRGKRTVSEHVNVAIRKEEALLSGGSAEEIKTAEKPKRNMIKSRLRTKTIAKQTMTVKESEGSHRRITSKGHHRSAEKKLSSKIWDEMVSNDEEEESEEEEEEEEEEDEEYFPAPLTKFQMPLNEALNSLRTSTKGKVLRNGRMRNKGNDEEKDKPSQCRDRLKLSTSTKNILLSGNSQTKRMPDKVNLEQHPGTSRKKMAGTREIQGSKNKRRAPAILNEQCLGRSKKRKIPQGERTMDNVDESEEEWSMSKEKPSLSKDVENRRTSVRHAAGSFKRYGDFYVGEWEDDTDDYEVFPLSDGHHIPSNTRSQGADVSPESKLKNSPKDAIKISGKLSACSSLPSWAPAKLNGEQCLGTSSKKKSPRANSTMDKVHNSEDEWNVFNEKSSLSND